MLTEEKIVNSLGRQDSHSGFVIARDKIYVKRWAGNGKKISETRIRKPRLQLHKHNAITLQPSELARSAVDCEEVLMLYLA